MQSWNPTVDDLPRQVWAEATQSTSLRDLSISVSYNIPGIFAQIAQDEVRATGIWSTVTAVAHDVSNVAGTNPGPPTQLWAPGSLFEDTEGPPRGWVDYYGGAGLRPLPNSDATGPRNYVRNVILIQFTVTPSRNPAPTADGPWEGDLVFFDPTRQVHRRHWQKASPTDPWIPTEAEDFPTQLDRPNDDTGSTDESAQVTAENHVYVMDSPGVDDLGNNVPPATIYAAAGRLNFYEFMRVGIGARPAGENLSGSRASPFFDWHSAHQIVSAGTIWQRTTGDNPESHGINSVGPIHITIGDQP